MKPTENIPPPHGEGLTRMNDCLPCPFCGSKWILKGERYFAICNDCGATGPERVKGSDGKAVKDWNTRA